MRVKPVIIASLAALLGFLIGRIFPPPAPESWDGVREGMHYSQVYEAVPELRRSLRELKQYDITSAHSGSRYWVLQVYYDEEGKVDRITREFR